MKHSIHIQKNLESKTKTALWVIFKYTTNSEKRKMEIWKRSIPV